MANPIGYLISSDFDRDGNLDSTLTPAFVMIKAGNCSFCKSTEPKFRMFTDDHKNLNYFFMRPFDGRDPRERETEMLLNKILTVDTETQDFGFPTFIYFGSDGKKIIHVGSMDENDMNHFISDALNPPIVLKEVNPFPFKAYNNV